MTEMRGGAGVTRSPSSKQSDQSTQRRRQAPACGAFDGAETPQRVVERRSPAADVGGAVGKRTAEPLDLRAIAADLSSARFELEASRLDVGVRGRELVQPFVELAVERLTLTVRSRELTEPFVNLTAERG